MGATTFFANMVRCRLLNTWEDDGTVTLTNGATTYSGSASEGDYVWLAADGIQYATKVGSAALDYNYLGKGGTSAGYYCTPELLAVLRGMELTSSWETAELYGTDSIFRVDQAKYAVKVETKVKYAKWSGDVSVDWVPRDLGLLRPLDVDTGVEGTIEETNAVFTNGIVYTIIGTDTSLFEAVCGETYWEGLPYPIPENEFMVRDIVGKAQSVTYHRY